jgi:beta-galactosidase
VREDEEHRFLFLLNHGGSDAVVELPQPMHDRLRPGSDPVSTVNLPARGVAVMQP